MWKRIQATEENGRYKCDYGRGVVKIALTGAPKKKKSKNISEKYVHYRGGIRALGKRVRIVNGIQHIEIFWIGDEHIPTEKTEFKHKIATRLQNQSCPYRSGKPCLRRDDDNTANTRNLVDSNALYV